MQNNSNSNNFTQTMQSLHFFPTITKPTHFPQIDTQTPTLLDHMWFNSLSFYCTGIINLDWTDHCPTFLQIILPESANINVKKNC